MKTYSNEELSAALNSVKASGKTKRFLERDLAKRNERAIWGYLMLFFGILILIFDLLSVVIVETVEAPHRSLMFIGFFFITLGQYRINRIKRRNIIIEILVDNN